MEMPVERALWVGQRCAYMRIVMPIQTPSAPRTGACGVAPALPPPPPLGSSATSLCPPMRISCCRFCRNRTVTSPPIAPSRVRKPLTRVSPETRLHHTTAALRLQIRGDHGEREASEKTDDPRRPHAEPFTRGAHRAA